VGRPPARATSRFNFKVDIEQNGKDYALWLYVGGFAMNCNHCVSLFFATASLATAAVAGSAQSALLFDNGTGNFTSFRSATNPPDGAGSGIAVSTATNLTNIGVDIAMPNGGDVKFLIFDSTNSTLLLATSPEAVAPSSTPAYVTSPNLSFTLNAGSTYYFGVIGDNNIDINFYVPPQPFDQNGLDALQTGNSNYDNFASPIFVPPLEGGLMTLQLTGTQAVVPAPLIGHGLPVVLAVGGILFGAQLSKRSKKRRSFGTAIPRAAA
jgi:hypothetical protein